MESTSADRGVSAFDGVDGDWEIGSMRTIVTPIFDVIGVVQVTVKSFDSPGSGLFIGDGRGSFPAGLLKRRASGVMLFNSTEERLGFTGTLWESSDLLAVSVPSGSRIIPLWPDEGRAIFSELVAVFGSGKVVIVGRGISDRSAIEVSSDPQAG